MAFNFPNNTFPGNNIIDRACETPTPRPPRDRTLNGLEEGDRILVQTPAGVSARGVFLRIENGFLIWVRTIDTQAFITISSLDEITITKL